jgi:ABC-2 type transport system permease protein
MTTWLTWEPRRGRVLAAKSIVAVVVVALAVAVFLALVALVYLPVGSLRGTTSGLTAAVWRTLSGTWLRAAGIAAFGAALGTGLATLTRNTAGAVGIGFAYGAIIDPLLSQLWRGRFRLWMFQHLLPRLLGLPVEVPAPAQREGPGVINSIERTLSITRPVVLLTVYAVGLLLVAYAAFRARDVT